MGIGAVGCSCKGQGMIAGDNAWESLTGCPRRITCSKILLEKIVLSKNTAIDCSNQYQPDGLETREDAKDRNMEDLSRADNKSKARA